jgi:hypothetical protein
MVSKTNSFVLRRARAAKVAMGHDKEHNMDTSTSSVYDVQNFFKPKIDNKRCENEKPHE